MPRDVSLCPRWSLHGHHSMYGRRGGYVMLHMEGHGVGLGDSVGLGHGIGLWHGVGLWYIFVVHRSDFLGLVYRLGHVHIIGFLVDLKLRAHLSYLGSVGDVGAAQCLDGELLHQVTSGFTNRHRRRHIQVQVGVSDSSWAQWVGDE